MSCEHTQRQLTAYLDGELDGDAGTVVRGHLRTCAACRELATTEAALRDALRGLPTVDPPAALWAGVQARLAVAEVAEAQRAGWRRALERAFGASGSVWTAMTSPRGIAGGLAIAALAGVLVWRVRHGEPAQVASGLAPRPTPTVIALPSPTIAPMHGEAAPSLAADVDVTADLQGEAARLTTTYATTVDELLGLADELRAGWSDLQRAEFDTAIAGLRAAAAAAPDERARQRELRALIRHVQRVLVTDEVALASTGAP